MHAPADPFDPWPVLAARQPLAIAILRRRFPIAVKAAARAGRVTTDRHRMFSDAAVDAAADLLPAVRAWQAKTGGDPEALGGYFFRGLRRWAARVLDQTHAEWAAGVHSLAGLGYRVDADPDHSAEYQPTDPAADTERPAVLAEARAAVRTAISAAGHDPTEVLANPKKWHALTGHLADSDILAGVADPDRPAIARCRLLRGYDRDGRERFRLVYPRDQRWRVRWMQRPFGRLDVPGTWPTAASAADWVAEVLEAAFGSVERAFSWNQDLRKPARADRRGRWWVGRWIDAGRWRVVRGAGGRPKRFASEGRAVRAALRAFASRHGWAVTGTRGVTA